MTNNQNFILLTIESSDSQLFQGPVKAVSSVNTKGPFDILPFHANFISLINKSIIIHFLDGKTKEYKINQGVMEVLENQVRIFVGIS